MAPELDFNHFLGVYSINGRRLICKMVNDLITVRMGGGYMPLSEYLKLYSPEDEAGDVQHTDISMVSSFKNRTESNSE